MRCSPAITRRAWSFRARALILCCVLILVYAASSIAADEPVFEIQRVAEGVYAAIPTPKHINNSNAAIVMLSDSVLVVDTHWRPSAARALIGEIKKLSDKPVRYVVDTHFHWDHYQGNQVYPSAWPGAVEIISSDATRESIEQRGIPHIKHELATLPQIIEKLKSELARTTAETKKQQLREHLQERESYFEELKTMRVTLPTVTFDRSLILHRPTRTVEILWLGKAHTDGDVFVYLPKEKVIVTGDVVSPCAPYLGDGYPYDWIKTLDRVERLDFEQAIGGHGEVMHGKQQFELFKEYLRELLDVTAIAYADGTTLDEIRTRLAPILQAKYAKMFPGGPPANGVRPPCPWPFSEIFMGNIEKAYRVVSGSTE